MLLPKRNQTQRLINIFALAIIVLTLIPLVGLIHHLWSPPPDPYGMPIPSISELFERQQIFMLLRNTIFLGVTVGFCSVILGSFFSYAEQFYQYKGKNTLTLLCLLGLAIPSYISAATIGYFFDVNNSQYPFLFSVLVLTLSTTPYAHLCIRSALSLISSAEIESLDILGGNEWQKIQFLVWPQIRSAVVFSFLISFLYSISDFGAVATLNTPVLTWKLYEAVQYSDIYSATILGFSLILCTLPILAVLGQFRQSISSSVSNVHPLKPQKPSIYILCSIYIFQLVFCSFSSFVPLYQIGEWIWGGIQHHRVFPYIWDAVGGSLGISIFGGFCIVVLAIFPAWSSSQYPKWKWLKQSIYLSSALPGILLAFALMLSALMVGGYQMWLRSGILLFIGLSIRFVAEGFGPLYTSFSQMDKRKYDSAVMLGSPIQKWLRNVLYPHTKTPLKIAFVISFLAIIKELPITLLLGSGISPTLAFRIWDRYNEALFFETGVYSLILLCISGFCTWFFVLNKNNN
jgi:iron(III) transport system permease protein